MEAGTTTEADPLGVIPTTPAPRPAPGQLSSSSSSSLSASSSASSSKLSISKPTGSAPKPTGNAPKPTVISTVDIDDDDVDGFFVVPSSKERNASSKTSAPGTGTTTGAASSAAPIDDQKIVLAKLKTREAEFTTYKPLTLYFGTWNVNGQDPSESLSEWLVYKEKDAGTGTPRLIVPDIYCIGFQELDLSASALMLGDKSQASPWAQYIERALADVGEYILLRREQLVGILLCVYVKRALVKDGTISRVQTGIIPAGIMGVMGNKGGVAIRFSVCESTFCVVNSHLNAHQENIVRRNQDFNDIARNMYFTGEGGEPMGVFDHDYLFWMGDLNYRINGGNEEVRKKVEAGEFDELLRHDQLKEQMRLKNAFVGFSEAKIAFAPTYKYDKNSTNYVSIEKSRIPAWCDRILWRIHDSSTSTNAVNSNDSSSSSNNGSGSGNKNEVTCLRYTRHELMSSDHRPVSGCFQMQVKTFIKEKRAQIYQELMRRMNEEENDSIPDIEVSNKDLTFGEVRFMVPCQRKITLRNVGKGTARWSFIPKPNETAPHKPWMFITPSSGVLFPLETGTVYLRLVVDSSVSVDISKGVEQLEDLLVFHVDKGKDSFISVSGSYVVSCFGLSLPILVHCTEPVRATNIAVAAMATTSVSGDTGLGVPKELWRIADYLYRHRLFATPGIYQRGAGPEASQEVLAIRECLDTGRSLEAQSFAPRSMWEAFIQFLDSLSTPVVPWDLTQACLDASSSAQASFLFATTRLDPVHYATFYYVVAVAKEILAHSEKNGMVPERLAYSLGPVLIKSLTITTKKVGMDEKKKADFVMHFIVDGSSPQKLPFPSVV